MFHVIKIILAVGVLIGGVAAAQAQDAPKREITQISGDLYRFQNKFHYSEQRAQRTSRSRSRALLRPRRRHSRSRSAT